MINIPIEIKKTVATPGAIALLDEHEITPQDLISRFALCDWGEHGNYAKDRHKITPEIRKNGAWETSDDAILNCLALEQGGRILASYIVGDGKIWIVHYVGDVYDEPTTMMVPSEY